jgi:hypothetical protein
LLTIARDDDDRVLPSLWAQAHAAGIGARMRTSVMTLDYALGSDNPLKRVPFYQGQWTRARAGGGPIRKDFELTVPDATRASTVRVYAVDADAIPQLCNLIERWGSTIGRREGYEVAWSRKIDEHRTRAGRGVGASPLRVF